MTDPMKTSEHSDGEQGNHRMSRREMEERLANGPANDYMKLAATAKQLAEWLRILVAPMGGGFKEDESREAYREYTAWLEDKDDG